MGEVLATSKEIKSLQHVAQEEFSKDRRQAGVFVHKTFCPAHKWPLAPQSKFMQETPS